MATISTSSIVDGQIIYAEHVLRIINALNGTASNEIIIADSLIQGDINNSTDGSTSHAEGANTDASGQYSHAEGQDTQAIGDYSHAEGRSTIAQGINSHAEGRDTLAQGNWSHAEGASTVANGNYSHAEGDGTETGADYQLAAGKFNTTGNTTDYVVIGYGTDNGNRADALGVNAAGTYISSALFLPTLLDNAQTEIITYDAVTKQVYYTSSDGFVAGYALTASNVTFQITGSVSSNTASFNAGGDTLLLTGSNSMLVTLTDNGTTTTASFGIPTNAQVTFGGITSSLFGTASWAQSSSQAITASYVDLGPISFNSESLGVNVTAVNVATTTILPRSPIYNNGTSGVNAYLTASLVGVLGAIDGITLVVGDTILVKNQVNQIQNGIYEIISTGSASTTYLLSRSLFSDQTSEFDPQVVIPAEGTVNRGLAFSQNTHNPVIGTDNITYSQQTGVFVSQQTTGTQNIYQIPWWTGVNRQLSRGSNNLKYVNTIVGTTVTTSSFMLTGSIMVSGGLAESLGSGHLLTYNTSSGLFSYTSSNALIPSGIPRGPITSVQFNDGSNEFSGSANFTFDKTNNLVNITGSNSTSASLVVTNGMVGFGQTGFTPAPNNQYSLHTQQAISASQFNIPSNGQYRFNDSGFSTFKLRTGFSTGYLDAIFIEGFRFQNLSYDFLNYQESGINGDTFQMANRFIQGKNSGSSDASKYFGINLSGSTPSSMLHVRGNDNATSSFALKVENSGSTQLLSATNDGNVTINNFLTLTPQHPLPSLNIQTGSFAVSSSTPPKPYFYDGTSWNALY